MKTNDQRDEDEKFFKANFVLWSIKIDSLSVIIIKTFTLKIFSSLSHKAPSHQQNENVV